jgi:predicted porin
MRKTLIALAVLGTAAGVAHAQSNVTIYGVVDTGYIKETGRSWRMGSNVDNRIGFRGTEDLGGGLKATFQLERRFDLNDGTIGNNGVPRYRGPGDRGVDWDGAANMGLAGDWGAVRFGRVNNLATETIRKFDPFNQFGVGSMVWSTQRQARISNSVRYDSPNWSGFSFGASWTLKDATKPGPSLASPGGNDNQGFGVNLSYDNGPLALTANFDRRADSNSSRLWNLGGAYKFGDAKVSLLYENTRDKGSVSGTPLSWGIGNVSKQQNWLLGLAWGIGPGELDASVQYFRVKDHISVTPDGSKSNWKYALGYTYNLSKRTSAYAQASYSKYKDELVGNWYHGALNRKSITGLQLGMTHKF